MADKVVVVDVQYDTDKAVANVVKLSDAIEVQRVKQAALKDNLKSGAITWDEYNKQMLKSKSIQEKQKEESKQQIKQLKSEEGSINRLRAEVSRLTKERNALNLNTTTGRKKLQEINKTLDKHNKTIKDSSDAYTKQKINIGNYKDSLNELPGSLGGAVQGIMAMTKAAIAFIATPLGAIIAAIVLGIKLLVESFKRSEENMNKVRKVIATITGAFHGLLKALQPIAEFLFKKLVNAFKNPKEALKNLAESIKKNLINRFEGLLELIPQLGKAIKLLFKGEFAEAGKTATNAVAKVTLGIDDMTGKIGKAGEKMKELSDSIIESAKAAGRLADMEAKLTKELRMQERIQLEYQKGAEKLRQIRDDESLSIEERIIANQKLGELLDKQSKRELSIALLQLKVARDRIKIQGDTTENLDAQEEALLKIAEIEERITGQRSEQLTNTNALFKEQRELMTDTEGLEQRIEIIQQENDLLDMNFQKHSRNLNALAKNAEEVMKKTAKAGKKSAEEMRQVASISIQVMGYLSNAFADLQAANTNKAISNIERERASRIAAAGSNADMITKIEEDTAKKIAQLKTKQAKADKRAAIINATIAGALAILNAFQSAPPASFIFAGITAALTGLQIAAIARQPIPTFAKGGMIGGKPHSQGGTKFYGEDGSQFEAERGEAMFVLKKDAAAEINALSMLNEAHGGRSFGSGSSKHLAEGGNVDISSTSIERQVDEAITRTPIFVRVGDIETGLTNTQNVKQAGVI